MSNYVDLKRNFVPVAEDAETDLAIGSLWGRKYGGWLDWPELLDHARVVLPVSYTHLTLPTILRV